MVLGLAPQATQIVPLRGTFYETLSYDIANACTPELSSSAAVAGQRLKGVLWALSTPEAVQISTRAAAYRSSPVKLT